MPSASMPPLLAILALCRKTGRSQTASAGCVAEGSMQRRGHGLDRAEEAIADVAGGGWWGGGAVS